jgi:DNA mismatch repair protein MSH5
MRRSTQPEQRRGCHYSVCLLPSSTVPAAPVDGMPLGTLDNTRTALGRSLLRTWLLRPSLSLEVINSRHDAVECFTRSENLDIVNIMHSQLAGIRNIPRILSALRTGKANLANWQGLVKVRVQSGWVGHVVTIRTIRTRKFTFHTAMLRDKLGELSMSGDVEIVKKVRCLPGLRPCSSHIN